MKISNLKEKLPFIMQIYILIQPLLDFLTSLMTRFVDFPLTIGIVFRVIFVLFIGVYLFFLYKGKYKKALVAFFIIICLYGAINILFSAYLNGFSTLFYNTKMFFKTYYFIFALIFCFAIYQDYKFVVSDKILTIVFLIYSASIFLSTITNTSFATYSYEAGYTGWFYAGNEIGAIISCLSAIGLIFALKSKHIFSKIVIFFLIAFTAVYIGTKLPFIASFGAIILFVVFYLLKYIFKKDNHSKKCLIQTVCVLLLTITLFQFNSPLKQNISTLSNKHFFDNVIDKLNDEPSQNSPFESNQIPHSDNNQIPHSDTNQLPSDDPNQISSVNDKNNLGYKIYLTANWLLSNRLTIIAPAVEAYVNANITQKLFGMGHIFETSNEEIYDKLIEMDFFALLINYGFIGTILYLLPICCFAFICIKKFFKSIKHFFSMDKNLSYIYAILISIGCAILAGHVFVAPAVSIYIAIIIIKLFASLKENKPKITDNDKLENCG